MANTVSILSYNNTFGDWVVTTNSLANENNNLATNNYIKSTGTLYLNEPTLGLQVGNNAVVAGQLQVQGVGSGAYVQNNLRVDGQCTFTNTATSINTSGQAIVGTLLSTGSGTGLTVSSNATINNILTTNKIIANTITLSGVSTVPTAPVSTSNTQIASTEFANTVTERANTYLQGYVNTFVSSGTASVSFNSLGVGVGASGTAGEIRATNQIVAYFSDENLKTKLGNIENALDKVLSLNGFYYEANQTAQSLGYEKKKEVGVSAQEVQKVLPEIVEPAPIDDKYLTIHYERLIPLLIESIKELKIEIDNLKKVKE